mmetsp:Transcript_88742/g.202977  ORF Transcript_88742/g.202977 Transcript_88742/m.202977 type:complete len:210 (-) Transcript_88742:66-695(-)
MVLQICWWLAAGVAAAADARRLQDSQEEEGNPAFVVIGILFFTAWVVMRRYLAHRSAGGDGCPPLKIFGGGTTFHNDSDHENPIVEQPQPYEATANIPPGVAPGESFQTAVQTPQGMVTVELTVPEGAAVGDCLRIQVPQQAQPQPNVVGRQASAEAASQARAATLSFMARASSEVVGQSLWKFVCFSMSGCVILSIWTTLMVVLPRVS